MLYRIDPAQVLFRYVDGEAVLIHTETSYYYGLNMVGTFVWRLLTEKGHTESELVDAIRKEYSPPPETAASDLRALLSDLKQEGLVIEERP